MSKPGAIAEGTRLGPYTLDEGIGQGASAVVFRANHDDGRVHAVKVRRRSDSPMDRRFLREFESMRLLRVPGVVQVHEAGLDDAWLWFSMDLVVGAPLVDAVLAEADVARRVKRAMAITERLCATLAGLHQTGYTHRDIKPSNVLVDEMDQVHVLDFGIGRFFNEAEALSGRDELVGTLPFMSPEQLAGLPNNEKADMFAVGLMLHECVAGVRPKPMTSVGWIPRTCLHRDPPLATLHREVPLGLSRVAERLCAVDPSDRPTAAEAARALRLVVEGKALPEWPEAPFCDPGDWWLEAEAAIGHGEGPRTIVLSGPTGSGRARIAEQLQRSGLLQGVWTLKLVCRIDEVGGPVRQLLERLVEYLEDAPLQRIVGEDSAHLRRIWPHLPLPAGRAPAASDEAPTERVAEAVADVVERLAAQYPLLLVFHRLEQVDVFTEQVIAELARRRGQRLGMVLLHESRWATPRSRRLVATLSQGALAQELQVPTLTAAVASEIAAQLCPQAPPPVAEGSTPQFASETGLAALARHRAEELPAPHASLWPLSVLDQPIPFPVLRALAGRRGAQGGWVHRTRTSAMLAGATGRALVRCRISSLQRSAHTLAGAWERVLGDGARPWDLAPLWLLAGAERQAWLPVARAAIESDRHGQYTQARRWLILLETLPHAERAASLDFALALTRARVALRTDASQLRPELIEGAERLAGNKVEEQRVAVLRAEYAQRAGNARSALVFALHAANQAAESAPAVAVEALMVAARARLVLHQPAEAQRSLSRARALIAASPEADPLLGVATANLESELLFLEHDLVACRELCQNIVREAGRIDYRHGGALAAARLGEVLRQVGHRLEAEQQVRAARDAFRDTGDIYLDAATGAVLATLLCERGDAVASRHLLDLTIRLIRGLNLEHLLPMAMRLALQVAALRVDATDAAVAIAAIEELPQRDPETPAAMVRWWRIRGDVERAMLVAGPGDRSFGATNWHLERARAALFADDPAGARQDAEAALDLSRALGFRELEVLSHLVIGATTDIDPAVWSELLREAARSLYTEVFLGALELDARRLARRGEREASRSRWRELAARSRELGYRPGIEEASGWLGDPH